MSTTKETVRVCDVCKKRVSDDGEIQFGGSAHHGWIHVERINGKTDLRSLRARSDWDVCGVGCLRTLAARMGYEVKG